MAQPQTISISDFAGPYKSLLKQIRSECAELQANGFIVAGIEQLSEQGLKRAFWTRINVDFEKYMNEDIPPINATAAQGLAVQMYQAFMRMVTDTTTANKIFDDALKSAADINESKAETQEMKQYRTVRTLSSNMLQNVTTAADLSSIYQRVIVQSLNAIKDVYQTRRAPVQRRSPVTREESDELDLLFKEIVLKMSAKDGKCALSFEDYFPTVNNDDAKLKANYHFASVRSSEIYRTAYIMDNLNAFAMAGMFGVKGQPNRWTKEACAMIGRVIEYQYNTCSFDPSHELSYANVSSDQYLANAEKLYSGLAVDDKGLANNDDDDDEQKQATVQLNLHPDAVIAFLAYVTVAPTLDMPIATIHAGQALQVIKTKHHINLKDGSMCGMIFKFARSVGKAGLFSYNDANKSKNVSYTTMDGEAVQVNRITYVFNNIDQLYTAIHRLPTKPIMGYLFADLAGMPYHIVYVGNVSRPPKYEMQASLKMRTSLEQAVAGTSVYINSFKGIRAMSRAKSLGVLAAHFGLFDSIANMSQAAVIVMANRFIMHASPQWIYGSAKYVSIGDTFPFSVSYLTGMPMDEMTVEMVRSFQSSSIDIIQIAAGNLYKNHPNYRSQWMADKVRAIEHEGLRTYFLEVSSFSDASTDVFAKIFGGSAASKDIVAASKAMLDHSHQYALELPSKDCALSKQDFEDVFGGKTIKTKCLQPIDVSKLSFLAQFGGNNNDDDKEEEENNSEED